MHCERLQGDLAATGFPTATLTTCRMLPVPHRLNGLWNQRPSSCGPPALEWHISTLAGHLEMIHSRCTLETGERPSTFKCALAPDSHSVSAFCSQGQSTTASFVRVEANYSDALLTRNKTNKNHPLWMLKAFFFFLLGTHQTDWMKSECLFYLLCWQRPSLLSTGKNLRLSNAWGHQLKICHHTHTLSLSKKIPV